MLQYDRSMPFIGYMHAYNNYNTRKCFCQFILHTVVLKTVRSLDENVLYCTNP